MAFNDYPLVFKIWGGVFVYQAVIELLLDHITGPIFEFLFNAFSLVPENPFYSSLKFAEFLFTLFPDNLELLILVLNLILFVLANAVHFWNSKRYSFY